MEGGPAFFAAVKAQIEEYALPQLAAYQRLPLRDPWQRCVLCGFPTLDRCDDPHHYLQFPLCRQPWCKKTSCSKCNKLYCGQKEDVWNCGTCSYAGCKEFACGDCDRNKCEGCDGGEWVVLCERHTKIHDVQPYVVARDTSWHGCWKCRYRWTKYFKVADHCGECDVLMRRNLNEWEDVATECAFCSDRTCPHTQMLGECALCNRILNACIKHVGGLARCKECLAVARKKKQKTDNE